MRGRSIALAWWVFLVACNPDTGLVVDIVSDYVAAAEFDRVRIELLDADGATLQQREVEVSDAQDFTRGVRVAEFGMLDADLLRVRGSLLQFGTDVLISREVLLDLRTSLTGVTLLITRACQNVECPGGGDDPGASSCLGAVCVPPTCAPETPATCPPPACVDDGACPAPAAACAEARCLGPVCAQVADDSRCSADEWCSPAHGCLPREAPTLFHGLVGYWPLDEAAGSTAFADRSRFGNDGRCGTCPDLAEPGVFGSAARFRAASDGIDVGDHASLSERTEVTVMGWVRIDAHQSYAYIASNDRDCCGDYRGYSLMAGHDDGPRMQIWNGFWDGSSDFARGTPVSLGEWTHVVGTYDRDRARVYINGVEAGSAGFPDHLVTPASGVMRLGAMGQRPAFGLDGWLDEVMVYDRALTANEIQEAYDRYVELGLP